VTLSTVVISHLEEQRKTMKNPRIIGVLDETLNSVPLYYNSEARPFKLICSVHYTIPMRILLLLLILLLPLL
jgi:hypothetical protein